MALFCADFFQEGTVSPQSYPQKLWVSECWGYGVYSVIDRLARLTPPIVLEFATLGSSCRWSKMFLCVRFSLITSFINLFDVVSNTIEGY